MWIKQRMIELKGMKVGGIVETMWMNKEDIIQAAQLLQAGEVVAFPTETVYGLGADATNEEAVKKIYQAKGRPSDNPLIVHVASIQQAEDYAKEIPPKARKIMKHFWPGPCTIILKKKGPISPTVTAGLDSVGLRMPDHPLAIQLIEETCLPLAAPSANSSGRPSPTSAAHVQHDLNGKIAGILDGGETGVGLESTVLDLTAPENPVILRPGGISKEEIEKVIGPVSLDAHLLEETQAPKSPGMKYKHYSPEEPVFILDNNWHLMIQEMKEQGEKVGILASEEVITQWKEEVAASFSLGEKANPSEASQRLYKGLRYFEDTEATVILAEAYPKIGIGVAYMNRLEKAASKK
jgi:L-threonylcarbamoyladenylate synthase